MKEKDREIICFYRKMENGLWCYECDEKKKTFLKWYMPYEFNFSIAPLWWKVKHFIWHKILRKEESLWD